MHAHMANSWVQELCDSDIPVRAKSVYVENRSLSVMNEH